MATKDGRPSHDEPSKVRRRKDDEDPIAAAGEGEGDRSILFTQLDDYINLDNDTFVDLHDNNDIPAFGTPTLLISTANLHASAAGSVQVQVGVDVSAGEVVVPEAFPGDDIDVTQLEWLSHFCEESYSDDSLSFTDIFLDDKKVGIHPIDSVGVTLGELPGSRISSSPISVLQPKYPGISPPTFFSTTVTSLSSSASPTSCSCSIIGDLDNKVIIPVCSRTKRPRPPAVNPPPPAQAPALRSGTTAASGSSREHDDFELVPRCNQLWGVETVDFVGDSKKKEEEEGPRPPPTTDAGEEAAVPSPLPAPVRKCSHCEVSKTPQWRAGPMGPKTLCNACGVRYKSGRLFLEYRPAASPTYAASLHSSSHRKVMEMRNREIERDTETSRAGDRQRDVASKACELLQCMRRREWRILDSVGQCSRPFRFIIL